MALNTNYPVFTDVVKEPKNKHKASCEVFKGCKEHGRKAIEVCYSFNGITTAEFSKLSIAIDEVKNKLYHDWLKEENLTIMLLQPDYKSYYGINYDLAWVYSKNTGVGYGLVLCHWNDGVLLS